ncbi:MAG: hypothetical protein ACOYUK_03740 [Patescibacteria group bacterium]
MATILIVSIVVHEIGHAVVLEANGVMTHMFFAIILGGVTYDKRYKHVEARLPWNTKALTYLAGVMGNLVVALAGGMLYWMGLVTAMEALQIVNLNAVLIFYNIFPVWITDGGRFTKIFFDSSPEHMDGHWVFRMLIPIGMAAFFLTIVSPQMFLFTTPVMFWSLHYQATHDDPKGSKNKLAMTQPQRIRWATIYITIFTVGMIMLAYTPDWILKK